MTKIERKRLSSEIDSFLDTADVITGETLFRFMEEELGMKLVSYVERLELRQNTIEMLRSLLCDDEETLK